MCLGEKPRRKNTQYGDLNPYPPSGTLVAQPLDPRRVVFSYKDVTDSIAIVETSLG